MKPIYINLKFYKSLPENYFKKINIFKVSDNYFWDGGKFICNPRYGEQKIWNFKQNLNFKHAEISDYTNKTYSEITDERSFQILSAMENKNKPLAIFWSGGVDSSLIVCSILKNFTKHDLSNVVIFMNNWSFYENPHLFNIIKKNNIKIININSLDNNYLNEIFFSYIVTDGEPADSLWFTNSINHFVKIFGFDCLKKSLKDNKQLVIKFLKLKSKNLVSLDEINYFFEFILNNVDETNAPVYSIGDFFWWVTFNYRWNNSLLNWYAKHSIKNSQALQNYYLNYYPWFSSLDYQRWSLSEISKSKFNFSNLNEYKKEIKEYCFSIDKNEYYFKYKTKIGSIYRHFNDTSEIILEDGTEYIGNLENFISENFLL